MPKVAFDFTTLHDLDPRLNEAMKQELRKLAVDLNERPGVAKPRKLKIEIALTPVAPSGVVESVDVDCTFDVITPKVTSPTYSAELHGAGDLMINPASPDNVHQKTFSDVESEKKES